MIRFIPYVFAILGEQMNGNYMWPMVPADIRCLLASLHCAGLPITLTCLSVPEGFLRPLEPALPPA